MDMKPVTEIPVVWADPPAQPEYTSPMHYRAAVLAHFRAQLVGNPGQWAVLPLDGIERASGSDPDYVKERRAKSQASGVVKGTGGWGQGGAGAWEARAVGIKTYVRFVPEETTP